MSDKKKEISFVFLAQGKRFPVVGHVGQTLLDVASQHGVPLEGSCGGCLSCATCHVYVDPLTLSSQNSVDNEKSDAEDDMLDFALHVTENSRLGCQVRVTENMDGAEITIPPAY